MPTAEEIVANSVTLTDTAFDVLYHGECGEDADKPSALESLSPGATYRQRVDLVATALAELRSQKLATMDTPTPELLNTIRLLHRPERRIFGWYSQNNRGQHVHSSFHLAISDEHSVLATRENTRVTLQPVMPEALYSTVAGLVPDSRPIDGPTIVVPVADRDHQEDTDQDWSESVTEHPLELSQDELRERDRIRFETLVRAQHQFAMQVSAHTRGFADTNTAEPPLRYYSGTRGSFIVETIHADAPAEAQRHLIPATRDTLRHKLQERAEAAISASQAEMSPVDHLLGGL